MPDAAINYNPAGLPYLDSANYLSITPDYSAALVSRLSRAADIKSLIQSPGVALPAPTILSRMGSLVMLEAAIQWPANSAGVPLLTFPHAGFKPYGGGSVYLTPPHGDAFVKALLVVNGANYELRLAGAVTFAGFGYWSMAWRTFDPWPTSWPGTVLL